MLLGMVRQRLGGTVRLSLFALNFLHLSDVFLDATCPYWDLYTVLCVSAIQWIVSGPGHCLHPVACRLCFPDIRKIIRMQNTLIESHVIYINNIQNN